MSIPADLVYRDRTITGVPNVRLSYRLLSSPPSRTRCRSNTRYPGAKETADSTHGQEDPG